MRILVISDSHGNITNLKHAMGFAKKIDADAIIHCGDWDNRESVYEVATAGIPVYGVMGNADVDPEVYQILKEKLTKFDPDFLKIILEGRTIGISHFPDKINKQIDTQKFDILFHGHTHRKRNDLIGKTRVVNPGALHRTADSSFAVYDTRQNNVEFVDL